MNGNFAATSTTQTPTTQNAGGNIPPNVSFVYTTDASGSGQSGTSQASTTTAAPMASSGPGKLLSHFLHYLEGAIAPMRLVGDQEIRLPRYMSVFAAL